LKPQGQGDAEREAVLRRFSRGGIWRQRAGWLGRSLGFTVGVLARRGAKRLLDITGALLGLALLAPILVGVGLGLLPTGRVLERTRRVGRWCEPFEEYAFAVPAGWRGRVIRGFGFRRLPVLVNVLRGDLSWVGPRAASPGELSPREEHVRRRYDVRPGLIGPWWVRRRANIDFESEAEVDREYVETQSLRGDVGIGLRAIPAALYGAGGPAPDRVTLLGITLHNLTMTEALEAMQARLAGERACQVCFVNADCANIAYRRPEYLAVLRQADLALADGIGLKLGGRLLRQPIKQNVNGTDLFPRLCAALEGTRQGFFLLGARPGIAEAVGDWIRTHHPGTRVCGARHGYFSPAEESAVVAEINASGAGVLLVALGAPRQDEWIAAHLGQLRVKVAMGVGGLFDFYSGRIPRAPLRMREAGLEWVYRFYQEPRRMWRRYLVGNVVFLWRVGRERLTQAAPPPGAPGGTAA
jgi:N-acetylglucosaminyldiphosphoundecaprenol N-acetyl-beta-D-mannosaminyltransferase